MGVLPPASLKVSRAARPGGSGAPLLALDFLARTPFLEVPGRPLCFSLAHASEKISRLFFGIASQLVTFFSGETMYRFILYHYHANMAKEL